MIVVSEVRRTRVGYVVGWVCEILDSECCIIIMITETFTLYVIFLVA